MQVGIKNAETTVRVVLEARVQVGTVDEFVAISDEPAAAGEVFILDRLVNDAKLGPLVSVIDSRPG